MFLGGAALAVYTILPERRALPQEEFWFRAAMSLVIAGIGAAFWFLGGGTKEGRVVPERRERHRDEPWLWREDWAAGYAVSESKPQAMVWALAGVICLLMSIPIGFQLPGEVMRRGNYPALLALVFPLVGLFLVGKSVAALLRDRKFRSARLELAQVPGALGGKLSGRLSARYPLPAGTAVELTLSCVQAYVSKSGSNRTPWQKVLWQDEKTATVQTDGQASYVPVDFTIPHDVKETDGRDPDNEILWRLGAQARVTGLDFRTTFTAPVFRTAASDPELTVARLDLERQRGAERPRDAQISGGVSDSGGMRFYLPPGRNKAAAATLTFFALLSIGSGTFFGYLLKQGLGWFAGLIPLVLIGGLGVLLLLLSLSLWFGSTTIEARNRELHVRTSWLGMSKDRVIRAAEIARLELHSGMQRGDQVWYDLRVHLVAGRKVNAGSGMSRKEADWVVAEIRERLSIKG
jgi:hypothetical protein